MAAPVRTSRQAWLEAGLRALGAGGVDSVRVETLAAELGVTKGGFYGQFRDRGAFLAAVLDEWERRAFDDAVRDDDELAARDPRAAIVRAGATTFSDDLLPVDLAIRAWGRSDAAVEARVRRVDEHRMAHLRTLFGRFVDDPAEVEARSLLAFSLMLGQHFLLAEHPGRSRSEAVALAARHLLR